MADGPTIIYDKSALQSLSKDEAFYLECHFSGVLTQTLLIEIVADLKKAAKEGRTPEAGVINLADKIGVLGTTPNVDYAELITAELNGYSIEMKRVPIVGGARMVTLKDGTHGAVLDEPPEQEAVRRWRSGDFAALEYALADHWRAAVKAIDLAEISRKMKWTKERRPGVKSLSDILLWVDRFVDDPNIRFHVLKTAFALLPVPGHYQRHIVDRWKRCGRPMLRDFAPYTRHVLRVDLFFYLGLAARLITDRPSNRIDMSYLYYLPFCRVFTSRDDLHKQAVPLFLMSDQRFIHGDELKSDLARLKAHYNALPPEVRSQGSRTYARFPPLVGDFAVARIYDDVYPGWREAAAEPPIEITPERNAEIMKRLRPFLDAIEEDERRRGRRAS